MKSIGLIQVLGGPVQDDSPGESIREIGQRLRLGRVATTARVQKALDAGVVLRGFARRSGRVVPVYRVKT